MPGAYSLGSPRCREIMPDCDIIPIIGRPEDCLAEDAHRQALAVKGVVGLAPLGVVAHFAPVCLYELGWGLQRHPRDGIGSPTG
jgi:hypothetical protein